MASTLQKIFAKIDTAATELHGGMGTPCWPWRGALAGRDKRPTTVYKGRREYVARLLCTLVNGPPPDAKSVARHKCDFKLCCRPDHLEWGTHVDNMRDMKERERHGLSHFVVRNIKRLLAQGRPQEEIAALYGVSRETISAIATGRVYSHVNPDEEDGGRVSGPQDHSDVPTSD